MYLKPGGKVIVCDEKIAKEIKISSKRKENRRAEQSSRVSWDDFIKQIQDAVVKNLT
jgi:hypothetical protein